MKTTEQNSCPTRRRCLECGMRMSAVNLVANLGLAVLKASVGIMAGSRALVAAALYSINDILSALLVMMSLRVAREPPDEEHAYGHGKVEFLAIGVLSLVLAVGVFFVSYFSLADIVRGETDAPHFVALLVAALSMGANWLLAEKGFCAAEALGSPALHSSAEHNRADAVSSLAVLIGVGFATAGFHIMDRLVAIFEALHILWLGGTLCGKALKGLMDTAASSEDVTRIRKACRRVDGVIRVVDLRTRLAGSELLADVVVAVSAELSVEEAEKIVRRVRTAVSKSVPHTVRAHVGFRPEEAPSSTRRRRQASEIHA